jgi:hypothetical protein
MGAREALYRGEDVCVDDNWACATLKSHGRGTKEPLVTVTSMSQVDALGRGD